jgi:Bacterial Ig-like domain
MSKLPSIAAQLPTADRRSIRDVEQEIRDELEVHLAMRTDELRQRGLPPAEARAAAVARFGDVERIRRACRKALLGERIMLQRLQVALIAVLLLAVIVLAYQVYSTQRTMADVSDQLTRLRIAAEAASLPDQAGTPAAWEADRPRVIETIPANGATDVDPATSEIRVTFDKAMADGSWSWVRSSPESFPESAGDVHYLPGMKTCVMPVKLEPGTKYVVWFNTANYQNFKDREGRPAVPHLLRFTTRE